MGTLTTDLKLALRGLWRNPIFTVFAVLSLALGIGANTAIFSAVSGVLMNSLGVEDPGRVVLIFTVKKDRLYPLAYQEYEYYKETNSVFSDVSVGRGAYVAMIEGDGAAAERVVGRLVSGNYFELLGVEASAGRLFTSEEDLVPGANPVIVLGHHYWQKRFAADPGVVGRTVILNGHPFTVIGVTADDFKGLSNFNVRDYWIPVMNYDVVLTGTLRRWFDLADGRIFQAFGRLKPGVSIEQAAAEMEALALARAEELPDTNKGFSIEIMPLLDTRLSPRPEQRQRYYRAGTGLMIVTALLLFIASANVANLLLARALSRKKEIALRTALGSARGRLARQFFTEGAVLAVLGCGTGLLIAVWGRNLLWALRPPFMLEKWAFPLDLRVLFFGCVLALFVALFFGLAPLFQAFKVDLVTSLKQDSDPLGGGGLHPRLSLRTALVVLQVAVSLVALVGAGLFIRSLQNTQKLDLGFDHDKLLVMSLDLGTRGYDEERGFDYYRRVVERVESMPGVAAAAISERSPILRATGFLAVVEIEGAEPPPDGEWDLIRIHTAGLGFFETLGIPLLSGRDFSQLDRAGTRRVAIINETMAKKYWTDSPVGRRIKFTDEEEPLEVIGVAADSTYITIGEEPTPYIYLPLQQGYISNVTLMVRTVGPPAAMLDNVRREAQTLDKDLAFYGIGVLAEMLEETLWPVLLSARLLSLFGVLALVLTAIGVFGVLSFEIVQRRRELGIRMALGGRRVDIFQLILGRCMKLTVAGIALGLIGVFASYRLVSGLLMGMSGVDPLSIAVSALVLVAIALVAGGLAGRRAVSIDPLEALRHE